MRTLTQPLTPSSLQETGENAGPVQRPDEGSPARGQGWPQEPSEGPALLRCSACTCPRMDNALSPLGTGEWGLCEWSSGDFSTEGGLHLFETPWEASLSHYGLKAQALPSCAWRKVLSCVAQLCVCGGVCVGEQVTCDEFSVLINTHCSYQPSFLLSFPSELCTP